MHIASKKIIFSNYKFNFENSTRKNGLFFSYVQKKTTRASMYTLFFFPDSFIDHISSQIDIAKNKSGLFFCSLTFLDH